MKATSILKFQMRKRKAKSTLEILKEEALRAVFLRGEEWRGGGAI